MSGCVLKYTGKRGTSWSIKYTDADGRQRTQTLGRASDGWTRRKAEAALRARLTDIERDVYREPQEVTFASFTEGWVDQHCDAKGLKTSTRASYRTIMDVHLLPVFGELRLEDVSVDRIERHLQIQGKAGVAPATLHRQLAVLSLVLRAAQRRGLVRANPVTQVVRPRSARRKWRILTPAEVGSVERAFNSMIAASEEGPGRDDLLVVRVMFLTMMGTGIRRGETLGLRWRSVALADPSGPALKVEETWVRNAIETPKSEAGQRTIALGKRIADELFEHRSRTPFAGEDERVFCNPRTGNAFAISVYTTHFRAALATAGIEGRVRPFHDLRHSSITNSAAAGTTPEALMSRAGHSSYATTRRYVDLAGERFREDADRLEERLWGGNQSEVRSEVAALSPPEATTRAANPHRY